ncbi:MAG TPA: hypothetical protein PLW88_08140 [Syntrophorhabdaceae bacterium]|nr:hypothetical protein [Syntrophorhabdaceae bacterium]
MRIPFYSFLERKGLILSKKIIWVTGGGRGIKKTLKDRYGKKLIHPKVHHP